MAISGTRHSNSDPIVWLLNLDFIDLKSHKDPLGMRDHARFRPFHDPVIAPLKKIISTVVKFSKYHMAEVSITKS